MPFYTQNAIILSSQARDKHRWRKLPKRVAFLQGHVALRLGEVILVETAAPILPREWITLCASLDGVWKTPFRLLCFVAPFSVLWKSFTVICQDRLGTKP
jgi:hypothetical protein